MQRYWLFLVYQKQLTRNQLLLHGILYDISEALWPFHGKAGLASELEQAEVSRIARGSTVSSSPSSLMLVECALNPIPHQTKSAAQCPQIKHHPPRGSHRSLQCICAIPEVLRPSQISSSKNHSRGAQQIRRRGLGLDAGLPPPARTGRPIALRQRWRWRLIDGKSIKDQALDYRPHPKLWPTIWREPNSHYTGDGTLKRTMLMNICLMDSISLRWTLKPLGDQ